MNATQTRLLLAALLLFLGTTVRAIVFYGTGDASFNTTAPTGDLAGSGWQYLGNWNGFVGTQISPNQFITASHVGGSVGGTFVGSDGNSYTTTAVARTNDLAIWTVSGTLPTHAPIYTGSSELSLDMTVFGRGVSRGAELRAPSATDADDLRGWLWGGSSALRWGTNQFVLSQDGYMNGSTPLGSILAADFTRNGGANEATVANGDSGGPTFVRVGGQWQLAGIVYGVQSQVRTTPTGTTVNAAIFDFGGLYSPNGSLIVSDGPTDFASLFLVSRLGADDNEAWILSQVPEPGWYAGLAVGGAGLAAFASRRRRSAKAP